MNLFRVLARIRGFLVVLIRGAALEKLLNLASAKGIYLWNIRRYPPDLMRISIGLRDFISIRPLLRRTRCRARIARRRGLPFFWRRLRQRAGLLVGFAVFAAVLIFLSNFIWFVDIQGVERYPITALRGSLENLGLHEGVLRRGLDKDWIQRELEVSIPELAWAGIEIKGVVAVVRVVERTVPPAPKQGADLIAAKDGLLTKVETMRGTPLVEAGDTVRAGQLLVSGVEVTVEADGTLRSRSVEASACIEARVWDEARASVPLTEWSLQPTGNSTRVVRLRLGGRLISIGKDPPPFEYYAMSRSSRHLAGGRNTLPLVEFIIDRYDEMRPSVYRRSPESAEELAAEKALELLGDRYPDGVIPGPASVDISRETDWIQAVATVETVQNIAVTSGNPPE